MKSNPLKLDSVGANASHRAGRQSPSHLTVSRPFGRPSLSRLDNPRLISTVERKPPLARGHRGFILGQQEWR